MLPYGALWDLDHKLHPTPPPRARTPRQRQRQAACVFVLGAFLVTIFLVPFHVASLRRLYIEKELAAAGLVLPTVDPVAYKASHDSARRVLNAAMAIPEEAAQAGPDDRAMSVQEAWRTVLYYSGDRLVSPQYHKVLSDGYVSMLAGLGAGRLWPFLNATAADLQAFHAAEGAAPRPSMDLPDTSASLCIATLRSAEPHYATKVKVAFEALAAAPSNTERLAAPPLSAYLAAAVQCSGGTWSSSGVVEACRIPMTASAEGTVAEGTRSYCLCRRHQAAAELLEWSAAPGRECCEDLCRMAPAAE